MRKSSSRQIYEDLFTLLGIFKANVSSLAEDHDLTHVQVIVLYAISKQQATITSLSHTMHCDISNITGLVDRLVNQGLVDRRENPNDRRIKDLSLTDKGLNVINNILQKLPDAIGCGNLSNQDKDNLGLIVRKLSF